jgi:hypothetical protein
VGLSRRLPLLLTFSGNNNDCRYDKNQGKGDCENGVLSQAITHVKYSPDFSPSSYLLKAAVNLPNCLIKKVLEMGIVASNKKVLEINET